MTAAQKTASNPLSSVWVSASAGTGKTKVLTDRVLRLLLEGVNPSKILCLTFTNAAAATEMSNRINEKLGQWVIMSDEELYEHIESLTSAKPSDEILQLARKLFLSVLDTPDGLKIQTIHSFCQSLMRRFPFEANIAPHFKVIEEYTSVELIKEARIRLLIEEDKQNEPTRKAIQDIAWQIHESSFTQLLKEVMDNRSKIELLFSRYDLLKIMDLTYNALGISKNDNKKSILASLYGEKDDYKEYKNNLKEAAKILLKSGKKDIARGELILKWLNSEISFDEYKKAFLTAKDEPQKSLAGKAIQEKHPSYVDLLYREQQNIIKINDKIKSVKIANLTKNLLHISESILSLYRKFKDARAYLDYSDLIIASDQLLHQSDISPWILYKLDGGIDHILLDEAQDTSPGQWRIVQAICEEIFSSNETSDRNRTVFVVGDEKQSIFSFQGADPLTFNYMHNLFASKIKNVGRNWESVSLDKSFRSTKPVLQLVDDIFSKEDLKQAITFATDPINHIAHRDKHAGKVQLWPLIEVEKSDDIQPWQLPLKMIKPNDPAKILAQKIAQTIKPWINDGRILKSKNRPVKPQDIIILVKTRGKIVDYLVSALKENNVPVAGVDRMVLTKHIAIEDLIKLGEFLLLPQDDLSLAIILKSPLIGISEDDLFELSYNRGKKSLWESLKSNERFGDITTYLTNLLNKTDILSPFELYSHIIEALEGRKKIISRLGTEVNDPIDEFLSLALDYQKTHTPSLQGFLHWLASGDTEVKRDFDQANNEVRIMTVHGSKGLQAPIIFMPDTTSTSQNKSQLLWSDDQIPLMLWPGRSENINEFCQNIKNRVRNNEKNEYLRLLYVALTRAEDELYVAGYKKKNVSNVSDDCWYSIIKNSMESIANKINGDILQIESSQDDVIDKDIIQTNTAEAFSKKDIKLPDFVFSDAPIEPEPVLPLTPSKLQEDKSIVSSPLSEKNILRGKIIHKLLEYLPEIEANLRTKAAEEFIGKYDKTIDKKEQKDILHSVFNVLNNEQILPIFSKNSKAEVPITGIVNNRVVSGRIDRLVIEDDYIMIVDYKTNRKPPSKKEDIDQSYIKQLDAYKAVLNDIYPNHKINCAIIWTEKPEIMFL